VTAQSAASRVLAIAVILTAVFVTSLDFFVVNVAFPSIAGHFGGADLGKLSWILNAYAIVYAAFLIPAGKWADLFGRRRFFLVGLGVFTVASLLCAAAPSVWMLVAARVLQAGGGAMLTPAATALLIMEFPPGRRTAAISLFSAVGAAAAALGTPLGGILLQFGWQTIFLINLPVGVLAFALGLRTLRESRTAAAGPMPDVPGSILLALIIGDLVLITIKSTEWRLTSETSFLCAIGAAAMSAWFLARTVAHPSPALNLALIRHRPFAMANATALVFAAGFGGLIFCNAIFLGEVWHSSGWLLGLELAVGPFTAATFAIPAGRVTSIIGPRIVAIAASLCFASGCLWLALRLGDTPRYLTHFLPGFILTGLGVGTSLASVSTAAIAAVSSAQLSSGAAVLNMSRQMGVALGVAILVATLSAGAQDVHAFRIAYTILAVISTGSAALALTLSCPKVRVSTVIPSEGGTANLPS